MNIRIRGIITAAVSIATVLGASAVTSQSTDGQEAAAGNHHKTVGITPLGQRTGEFCALDRALLFEDPTGVRILYDPGNTITGALPRFVRRTPRLRRSV